MGELEQPTKLQPPRHMTNATDLNQWCHTTADVHTDTSDTWAHPKYIVAFLWLYTFVLATISFTIK